MTAGARPRRVRARDVAYAVVAAGARALPTWVARATAAVGLLERHVARPADVDDQVRRGRPALVILDGRGADGPDAAAAVARLKADAYTAVVPCLVVSDGSADAAATLFEVGADDVVAADGDPREAAARVAAAVRRSVRDLSAQPTTRLPAAGEIEREIDRRIAVAAPFAACYADLDHFKEFNDRYGYHEGDRVIRMVARILHDAAAGVAGLDAFVGHVGGDDFMLVLPLAQAAEVCALAVDVFDTFVPFQYSEADRRAGYYFGKDRRGQLHRVPLMTLSIGVATTERRQFRSAAEVSHLASEMKSFAKAKPGSVVAVDRRGAESAPLPAPAAGSPATPSVPQTTRS